MPVITGHDAGAENQAFVLPKAVYKTIITKIVEKTSKAGNLGLIVEFQIVEGKFKNKEGSTWLNTGHPDPEVKVRGMGQYNSFFDCLAPKPLPEDKSHRTGNTDDILNKPMNITWSGKLGDDGFAEYNFYPSEKEPTPDLSEPLQATAYEDGVPF